MNFGQTVFSQVMDFLPLHEFRRCVERYRGHYKIRNFSCLDQFFCMAFAQLTYRESLRDIEVCLRSQKSKLYHRGFRGKISRNTLSNANRRRDWRIYADFSQVLIATARTLYSADDFGADLAQTAYALDSTIIDLCLATFPWARFRQNKGAIKLHTLLDLRGSIPTFISISDGKLHDVNALDLLLPEPGAFYVMDRAYIDFTRLHRIHSCRAFFVTRQKSNMRSRRIASSAPDKINGILCDQMLKLTGFYSSRDYPDAFRRIKYFDATENKTLEFLTNDTSLPAFTIAQLYRCRWQVELFFKWIKQHLRIKAFYGVSENAVKTQVWIAISVYVLIAIIKKRLGLEQSLYKILQVLSISLFEKTPIQQAFADDDQEMSESEIYNQLNLFG